MTTLNLSISESTQVFIEKQLASGKYTSASQYLQALIQEDQKRKAQDYLESSLVQGLQSGKPIEVTEGYWEEHHCHLPQSK